MNLTKNNIGEIVKHAADHFSDACILLINNDYDIGLITVIAVEEKNVGVNARSVSIAGLNFNVISFSMLAFYSRLLTRDIWLIDSILNSIVIKDEQKNMYKILLYLTPMFTRILEYPQSYDDSLSSHYVKFLKNNVDSEEYTTKLISLYLQHDSKQRVRGHENIAKEKIELLSEYFRTNDITLLENSIEIAKKKNDCLKVCFEGSFSYPEFIEYVFIPLSRGIKQYLPYAYFSIEKPIQNRVPSAFQVVCLTYYFDEGIDPYKAKLSLTQFLFENLSELQLGKVYFADNALSTTPNSVELAERLIWGNISSEILAFNAQERLTYDKSITYCIYFYIAVARYYYMSAQEFKNVNSIIFDLLLPVSISGLTNSMLNTIGLSAASEKIQDEYNKIHNSLKVSLENNYQKILDFSSNHDFFPYLSAIADIKKNIENNTGANDDVFLSKENSLGLQKDTDQYFAHFAKILFAHFFIEPYYKAFIPYVVNKMIYEKVGY